MNIIEQAIEALERWADLIIYQYSGSSEAMSDLQEADNFGQQALYALHTLKAHQQAAQDVELPEPALWFDPETGHWKKLTKPDRPTYEAYYTADQMRAAIEAHQARQAVPQVDRLAQIIRTVDGSHTLGAGALAEKIVESLAAAPTPEASQPERSRSQRLRNAGFTPRPSWRALPSDDDTQPERVTMCPETETPCTTCPTRGVPCEATQPTQAHDLYTDADKDRPAVICDRNGSVTLSLCKRCGKGEAQLDGPCQPAQAEAPIPEPLLRAIREAGLTLLKTQSGYQLRKVGPAVAQAAIQPTQAEAPQTFAEWLNDRRDQRVAEVFLDVCLRVAEEINATHPAPEQVELSEDAERYRWLFGARTAEECANANVTNTVYAPPKEQDKVMAALFSFYICKEDADTTIDAAREAQATKGGEAA